MCPLALFRQRASETMPVFKGKLQAFERPYFHDEKAAIHTLLRGTSRSLHMRAKLVSLFRSLLRDSCIYAFPPTGCSLTRIHAYMRAETTSKTRVNRPYLLHAIKKNNIVDICIEIQGTWISSKMALARYIHKYTARKMSRINCNYSHSMTMTQRKFFILWIRNRLLVSDIRGYLSLY